MKKIQKKIEYIPDFLLKNFFLYNIYKNTKNSQNLTFNNIFIACMPKSASTYLAITLNRILNYKIVEFKFSSGNEQDMYVPNILKHLKRNTITQQHCKGSTANIEVMKIFQIKPIILTRDIFDIVISLRDHFDSPNAIENPTVFITEDYYKFDKDKQYNFIIDLYLPWYFAFYSSWITQYQNNNIDMLWLSYEELIDNKFETIKKILNFYSLEADDKKITDIVNKKPDNTVRYNKGVKGRGQKTLTNNQLNRITKLCNYYPNIDFNLIGIAKNQYDKI